MDVYEAVPVSDANKYTMVPDIPLCYCGSDRELGSVELNCFICRRWVHQRCIAAVGPLLGKSIGFMTNYTFSCKSCSSVGQESFSKKQANFTQMAVTAMANMQFAANQAISDQDRKSAFSSTKELVPFIDSHWEELTTMPRRLKYTWHGTVYKNLLKETELFKTIENTASPAEGPLFSLVEHNLGKIGPNFEILMRVVSREIKSAAMSQSQSAISNSNTNDMSISSDFVGSVITSSGKGQRGKRKFPEVSNTITKKQKSDLTMPKLPTHGYPSDHPYNKDGYRYLLAEPDPHAPFRQEFDESNEWSGKPIPGFLYRTMSPPFVLLALHDTAPQLRIAEDRVRVTGDKGYSMVRCTHCVNRGSWYFECVILDMPEGSATRIGWSQPLGNLQAPLGYDKFSYSWRSRKGTKFHESRGKHYADEGYGKGDVLGFLLKLPDKKSNIALPFPFKDRPLVKFKSHLYFEEKDNASKTIKRLKPLAGSQIICFKNGKDMGVAYSDIYAGNYFPAISLYKNCHVKMNVGPTFNYQPVGHSYQAMCDAALVTSVEHCVSDCLFLVENEGKLRF